jgi:hypothetical protein
MHKYKVKQKLMKTVETVPSWDWAIDQARMRIKRLRESIRVFKKMRDTGERWRGAEVEKALEP